MMPVARRRFALAAAALATAAATAWVASADVPAPHAVLPAAPHGSVSAPAAAPAPAAVEATAAAPRAPFAEASADPFAVRSWAPAVVENPPPPMAPPLPFKYFGRMAEADVLQVFLQRGERTYSVAVGDVVDHDYRIEAIRPDAVVITYLPLAQRQVLNTGSSSR